MLPQHLPPPLDRAASAGHKEGFGGPRAMAVTQAIALAAAGAFGTILVIGVPLLLRQNTGVADLRLQGTLSPAGHEIAALNVLHWIVLALVAITSICLVVA